MVFGQTVIAVEGETGDLLVQLSDGTSRACGGVLMATGRRPWLQNLGLDEAGISVEAGRIQVDSNSCTSVPHIYAVGDVTD